MNKILLDSSVIVDFLRTKNKNFPLLQQLADQNYKLYISILSHTELYAGKSIWEKDQARQELELVLSGIDIIYLDANLSQKAGKIRSDYNLGLADAIIVSTAISQDLELATFNTKDFKKVKGVKLFKTSSAS